MRASCFFIIFFCLISTLQVIHYLQLDLFIYFVSFFYSGTAKDKSTICRYKIKLIKKNYLNSIEHANAQTWENRLP